MNCTDAQDIMGKEIGGQDVGETQSDLATEHVARCSACKTWFSTTECPKITSSSSEETGMMHGAFHEALEIADCSGLQ